MLAFQIRLYFVPQELTTTKEKWGLWSKTLFTDDCTFVFFCCLCCLMRAIYGDIFWHQRWYISSRNVCVAVCFLPLTIKYHNNIIDNIVTLVEWSINTDNWSDLTRFDIASHLVDPSKLSVTKSMDTHIKLYSVSVDKLNHTIFNTVVIVKP